MAHCLLVTTVIIILGYADIASTMDGNCSVGEARLTNGPTPNEGHMEICTVNRTWGTVCDYSFTCPNAQVACRQLGYTDPVETELFDGDTKYGPGTRPKFGMYRCKGSEPSLLNCSRSIHWGWGWFSNNFWCGRRRLLGLKCRKLPSHPELICKKYGDIRLIGGQTPGEGLLQICMYGAWRVPCGEGCNNFYRYNDLARVVCRQLGYSGKWASLFHDGRYIHHTLPLVRLRPGSVRCSGNEKNITFCSLRDATCTQKCLGSEIGVKCDYGGEVKCKNDTIRLVGGPTILEGRLEMCVEGVWGIVCSPAQTNNHATAQVACRQLGFSSEVIGVMPFAPYGDGNGPVMYSTIQCDGNETSLFNCQLQSAQRSVCNRHTETFTIRCTDGCTHGFVRLVGGGNAQEGTVELCINGQWTLVGDDGWDDSDAEVVCIQMGFHYTNARAVRSTFYGRSQRHLYYTWVDCSGTETNITQCMHGTVSNDIQTSCASVAGVICHTTPISPEPSSAQPISPEPSSAHWGPASIHSSPVLMHHTIVTSQISQSSCSTQASNISPTTVIKVETTIQATILGPVCPNSGT